MSKRPLKRSMTGLEVEFHLVDQKGRIVSKGPELVDLIKSSRDDVFVCKEIGRNLIEFGAFPDVHPHNTALDLIHTLEQAHEVLDRKKLMFYPFATYPGRFKPRLTRGDHYTLKEKIFGKRKIHSACRVAGFHHHYALPKGVFDSHTRMIKFLKKSKLKQTLVSSYNFEIASDPVLTLFTQSSPFYQGTYLAKDSRMIVYRGGKRLGYMAGVYSDLQQVGGLPRYIHTATDLLHGLKKRLLIWERELHRVDPKAEFDKLYPSKLDASWQPVRINKHGTLEQRGMDMNFLSVLIAVTVLLRFSLKKIHQEFIEVVPTDFGHDEAFKLEDEKIYVPPDTYVVNKLQKKSAFEGYSSKQMHHYAKRWYHFAKSLTPKEFYPVIAPVGEMIETKKSMSDRILAYAKYKGYLRGKRISNRAASSIAVYYAQQFFKDLEKTKAKLEKVAQI